MLFILPITLNPWIKTGDKLESDSFKTQKVVGFWQVADPDLKHELVVIGGHYDHLGARNGTMLPMTMLQELPVLWQLLKRLPVGGRNQNILFFLCVLPVGKRDCLTLGITPGLIHYFPWKIQNIQFRHSHRLNDLKQLLNMIFIVLKINFSSKITVKGK